MLPINTQAQANADKFILDTLQRQGEELSKQSKNIEKLVTELNRQRRANEKLRTNSKATDSTEGPGILNTPMADLLKMFKFESGDDFKNNFGKRKNSKSNNSIEKEETDDKKSKEKMDDEDQNILKNLLDKFTESSEFQKQMSENSSKLLTAVDLAEKNIAVVKDDISIIKKSYEEGEQDTFAQRMGKAVADNISNSFAPLLKTAEYKQFTKDQTTRIVDALEGMGGGEGGDDSGGGGFDIPGAPGGNNSKGGTPKGGASKPNKGSRTMRKAKIGARNLGRGLRKLPFGRLALGAATGLILYEGLTHAEELNTGEQDQIDQFKEENPNLFKTDQDIANDPNANKNAKIVAEKNLKLQEDIKKYGEEEAKNRAVARDRVEERLRQRKIEKEKISAIRDKSLNADEIGNQLPKQKLTKEVGPQEPLIIPNELNNLDNKLNQMNTDETGKALTPVSADAPKLLNSVTEQKQELADNKSAPAPITVINNNTNNVAGGGSGQSMNFASATPINTETSINDFFRSHGRIFT